MRRIASHYIFWQQKMYRMHYVEYDNDGRLTGVYPLTHEISGTSFFDGVLLPLVEVPVQFQKNTFTFQCIFTDQSPIEALAAYLSGCSVKQPQIKDHSGCLLLLNRLTLSAPELGTNNGCCNGNIERL